MAKPVHPPHLHIRSRSFWLFHRGRQTRLETYLQLIMAEEVFAHYDKNGDGTIDGKELEKAFKELDLVPSAHFMKRVKKRCDTDGDGKLTKEEFINVAQAFDEIEGLAKLFDACDKDADGLMTIKEMMKKASTFFMDERFAGGKMKEVLDHWAGDKEATMSPEEFLQILFKDRV